MNGDDAPPARRLRPPFAAALAYLFWILSGLVVLALERQSAFVRFHALQSVLLSLGVAVWLTVVVALNVPRVPLVGFAVYVVSVPVALVAWLLTMVKAYQGEWFALPVIGALALRLSGGRVLAPTPRTS